MTQRTHLLFTGIVAHCRRDNDQQLVTVQLRDDKVTYSMIDDNCNIQSSAVDAALQALGKTPLVTFVTPRELITNIPLTDAQLVPCKYWFGKAHRYLQFTFAGTQYDAAKVRRGMPLQVYAVNLNLPCGP